MKGIIYAIGVGPGDPELMTLKAVRLIRACDVIAVPGTVPEASTAYRVARAAVPELAGKECVGVPMPMVRDRAQLDNAHREAAEKLKAFLDNGKNVAYLTLGDPAVYCTFSYLQRILQRGGCRVELVSGVPSFCAAAARLGMPLAEGDEPLNVLPTSCALGDALDRPGACVLMKAGKAMPEVKSRLRAGGRRVFAVENCGMEGEKIYRGVEEIPDDAGYFTLIVAKEPDGA